MPQCLKFPVFASVLYIEGRFSFKKWDLIQCPEVEYIEESLMLLVHRVFVIYCFSWPRDF